MRFCGMGAFLQTVETQIWQNNRRIVPLYRGTWSCPSLMWPGQLFRHTLILSFFSTAIAHDWTVDSLLQLYRTISRDIGPGQGQVGWYLFIRARTSIQLPSLTSSWPSAEHQARSFTPTLHWTNPQVRTLYFHWTLHFNFNCFYFLIYWI